MQVMHFHPREMESEVKSKWTGVLCPSGSGLDWVGCDSDVALVANTDYNNNVSDIWNSARDTLETPTTTKASTTTEDSSGTEILMSGPLLTALLSALALHY